jgi:4-hydroxy-3-methylbut-2-enyl diphosphate reductase
VLIALAWMAITCVVPWLAEGASPNPYLVMGLVFLLSFIRAVFLEVLEVQGDGFVGKETLPVFLGEKKTFLVLKLAIALLTLVIVTLGLSLAPGVMIFLFVPAYTLYTLRLYERRLLGQALRLEALSEGLPLVTFLCTLLWSLLLDSRLRAKETPAN